MLPYDTQSLPGLTVIRPMPPRALYTALLVGGGRITVVPGCTQAAGRGDFLSLDATEARRLRDELESSERMLVEFARGPVDGRPLGSDWRLERHADGLVSISDGDRRMWWAGSMIDRETLTYFRAALDLAIERSRSQA